MMGIVLALMLVISIVFGVFNNQTGAMTKAVTDGAGDAIQLSIAMIGLMAFWSGMMEIAKKSGLVDKLSKILRPVIRLFISEAKNNKACGEAISLNITANILGLGNAATPKGILAMKKLKENHPSNSPSRSMTYFLVLNCASIQLVPSTIAAIRSATGAIQPFKVMPAIWITSGLTLVVGMLTVKVLIYFVGGKNGN